MTGDLKTPQILIEDGANFKGSIEIESTAHKEADKNISSRMESAPNTPLTGRKVA